MLRFKVVA